MYRGIIGTAGSNVDDWVSERAVDGVLVGLARVPLTTTMKSATEIITVNEDNHNDKIFTDLAKGLFWIGCLLAAGVVSEVL